MVVSCWCVASVIHYCFLNLAQTVASEKYVQQISRMNSLFSQ